MKIKLIQSGGIAGTKLTANVTSKLTDAEWESLIASTKKSSDAGRKAKDAFHYTLQKEDDDATKTVIDIQAIPEEHNELFEKLFNNLKPEKKK